MLECHPSDRLSKFCSFLSKHCPFRYFQCRLQSHGRGIRSHGYEPTRRLGKFATGHDQLEWSTQSFAMFVPRVGTGFGSCLHMCGTGLYGHCHCQSIGTPGHGQGTITSNHRIRTRSAESADDGCVIWVAEILLLQVFTLGFNLRL